MSLEEKIRLTKAVLIRIYKNRRQNTRPEELEGDVFSVWVNQGAFNSLGDITKAELNEVILPYLKEMGLLKDWEYNFDGESAEYGLFFNTDVMDGLKEPIAKSTPRNEPKVEFDDLLAALTFKGYSYRPTGEIQKKAMKELWDNRKDPAEGIKGQPLPLFTLGSRIEFKQVTSATKFKMMLENDEKFEERFRNFYKSIRKSIADKKIPVSIDVGSGGILMTILPLEN